MTALEIAVFNDDFEITEWLVVHGSWLKTRLVSLLEMISTSCCLAFNPPFFFQGGWSEALLIAIEHNNHDIIVLLLHAGADVNTPNQVSSLRNELVRAIINNNNCNKISTCSKGSLRSCFR
jgi:sRNA-binding carbon storage regulator CsrA